MGGDVDQGAQVSESDFLAAPSLILRHPWLFGLAVFATVLLTFQLGRFLGRSGPSVASADGLGLMDGAVFALLGLLLAFTFSAASTRFDLRRSLIVEEANAIGTARLRTALLPEELRPEAEALFDRYVESRQRMFRLVPDEAAMAAEYDRGVAIQNRLWALATEAGRRPDAVPAVHIQLLPALNAMFDIATTQTMTLRMHTPVLVHGVLWLAALIATLIAGHSTAHVPQRRYLVHAIPFALLMAGILYLIIDLEYPRAGFIRVDSFDPVLGGEVWPRP
jgi:hypothetical protein